MKLIFKSFLIYVGIMSIFAFGVLSLSPIAYGDHTLNLENSWDDIDLIAGTIYGEARSEPRRAKEMVGITIATRVSNPGWWGNSWEAVILKPKQFSCWWDNNLEEIKNARKEQDEDWINCKNIAESIYHGRLKMDGKKTSTHYHDTKTKPAWSYKLNRIIKIGCLIFYS